MAILIISNDEIHDIIKIVKSLEDSGLLLKGVTKRFQNEVKEQKGGFPSMLLGTLGASLLGTLLTGKGKGAIATSQGRGINRMGEGVLRAGYGNKNNNNNNNNNNDNNNNKSNNDKKWIFNATSSFN